MTRLPGFEILSPSRHHHSFELVRDVSVVLATDAFCYTCTVLWWHSSCPTATHQWFIRPLWPPLFFFRCNCCAVFFYCTCSITYSCSQVYTWLHTQLCLSVFICNLFFKPVYHLYCSFPFLQSAFHEKVSVCQRLYSPQRHLQCFKILGLSKIHRNNLFVLTSTFISPSQRGREQRKKDMFSLKKELLVCFGLNPSTMRVRRLCVHQCLRPPIHTRTHLDNTGIEAYSSKMRTVYNDNHNFNLSSPEMGDIFH